MATDGRRRIKTADRVFDIIGIVQEKGRVRIGDVANRLNLSKSTVHEYLYTLADRGYLVRDGDEYQLGLRFLDHGQRAKDRYEILSFVQQSLCVLSEKTDEAVWYMIEEQKEVVYLANELGENAVQTHARIGGREHLHCTAGGKAILAFHSEEKVSEIIERNPLPAKTEYTITDPDVLSEELETVRQRRYAVNDGETAKGEKAIAAPIRPDDPGSYGAIAIAGPRRRIDRKQREEGLSDLLLGEVEEIALRMNWNA